MGTAHRNKHSSFSTTFPIYLFTQRTDLVPDEEAEAEASTEEKKPQTEADDASADEEEAVVEDVTDKDEETTKEPKMKEVVVDDWVRLNSQPPIWMRLVVSTHICHIHSTDHLHQ